MLQKYPLRYMYPWMGYYDVAMSYFSEWIIK